MQNIGKATGKRIRHLRSIQGLTQQELGEKADVNYKYLGAVERGEKNPTIEHIAKIAKALDVEPYQLLVFKQDVKQNVKEELREKINVLLGKADIKEIEKVYRVIEVMLEQF